MKKIIIFIILALIFIPKNILAQNITFYEGEYINNVWMNKVTPDGKTIYYQKARFFRDSIKNQPAYCIEPFEMFNDQSIYESTITPEDLTSEQIKRMKQLAYLGYNYGNRKTNEWYAVTQLLIWQTAEPTGNYYFTDKLNGNKIDKYQSFIDELNKEIENYNNNPEFKNEYSIIAGEKIEIEINNTQNLKYTTDNKYTTIENNKIIINNLPVGNHEIKIIKQDKNNNQPILFYQSPNSQNLMTIGSIEPQEIIIKIKVQETEINIIKLDKDTNSTLPTGSAKLEGTTFELYDQNMNKLTQLKIDKTSTVKIKNIPYGIYFIKEVKAGEGYKMDNTIHKINITENNPKINIKLTNEVIIGKLEINKVYIDEDKEFKEPNITFNIYDNKNKLYKTITTNNLGYASINLPYGTYTIKQETTTEGYDYVEPFTVSIKNETKLTYKLTNKKIIGKLEINKVYIDEDKEFKEPNITFNIYDNKNKLYKTITTNNLGYASINLPYGTYTIKQETTTEGYDYVEPFTVSIKNNTVLSYNLKNYKIKVPNTYIENNTHQFKFIKLIKIIIENIIKVLYANKNNIYYNN